MFTSLTLTGGAAQLLWGYRTAAHVGAWRIKKSDVDGRWTLTATLTRIDAFQLRQTPLLFTAPRPGGFWCWPVTSLQVGTSQLVATLGPPEQ